ncbi:alpha/beta hydrolase [Bermanella sp. R86510]|uniref:alpha/beta hydrolase n=1 Tax=unclassified Bermanella TaxID=2627862 RepID=UPI0037C661E1
MNNMASPISIKIKSLELRGLAWGDPKNEPVLALHGWLDNAASFNKLAPLLEHKYVVAIDLPGHGQSDHWPDKQHYHLWEGVEHIELIADQLNFSRFHLVGHSMGAAMATLYAGTFPGRLKSFTAIEAFGPMAGEPKSAPERLANAITTMKRYDKSQSQRPKVDPQAFIQARMQGPMALTEEAASMLVERGAKKTEDGWVWSHDKRLQITSMMRLSESLIGEFIKSINAPVLGLFAHHGLYTDKALENRWQLLQSPKTLQWFSGGHHFHMQETVEDIATAMNEFYNKLNEENKNG